VKVARVVVTLVLAGVLAFAMSTLAAATPGSGSGTFLNKWHQAWANFTGTFGGDTVSGHVAVIRETVRQTGSLIEDSSEAELSISSSTGGIACYGETPVTLNGLVRAGLDATRPCFDGAGNPAGEAVVAVAWRGIGPADGSVHGPLHPGSYGYTERIAADLEGSISVNGVSVLFSSTGGDIEIGTLSFPG